MSDFSCLDCCPAGTCLRPMRGNGAKLRTACEQSWRSRSGWFIKRRLTSLWGPSLNFPLPLKQKWWSSDWRCGHGFSVKPTSDFWKTMSNFIFLSVIFDLTGTAACNEDFILWLWQANNQCCLWKNGSQTRWTPSLRIQSLIYLATNMISFS